MKSPTELSWKEMPHGAVIEGGTAEQFETGDWRSLRPVWDEKKCIHCLICWIYCPDSSILVKDGKMVGIDLKHCKGCGICAIECPQKVQAISMVAESEFRD